MRNRETQPNEDIVEQEVGPILNEVTSLVAERLAILILPVPHEVRREGVGLVRNARITRSARSAILTLSSAHSQKL